MKYSSSGFLLIECMIAIVVLSLAIAVCAGGLFSILKDYSLAKGRLCSISQAQSLIESHWHEDLSTPFDSRMLRTFYKPIKHGIRLPNRPSLKLEYIEIIADGKQGMLLAGHIKE